MLNHDSKNSKMKTIFKFITAIIILNGSSINAICIETKSSIASDGGSIKYDGTFYDYRAADGIKLIKIWTPPASREIKGAIVSGHGGREGDSRNMTRDMNMRQFAARIDFAIIGLSNFPGDEIYSTGGEIFIEALNDMAEMGVHPELANIPFIFLGSSNGGATAYGFANYIPERTICFTTNVMSRFIPKTPTSEALKVPAIMVVGPFDPLVKIGPEYIRTVIETTRKKGSRWSWIAEQGKGHEDGHIMDVFMTFYKNSIQLRYPDKVSAKKQKINLIEIPETEGWLADHHSWESGITSITPYRDYKGDKTKASWLIDKDMAFLYRGLATYNKPITLGIKNVERTYNANFNPYTMFDVGGPVKDPGKKITIQCDIRLPKWEKVEFYNASKKLGEVGAGKNELDITILQEEFVYSITALVYAPDGKIFPSTPMHFIVRDPKLPYRTDKETHPFTKVNYEKNNTGSKYIDAKPDNYPGAIPDDNFLIVYALTAEQERQFNAGDGKVSEFWNLMESDHDRIHLNQQQHALECNRFQGTITHDAGLIVKAVRSASGIYFYFEGIDNKWMNQEWGRNAWINDAIDIMMDCKSSDEICNADPASTLLMANAFAITAETKQYKINFGGNQLPQSIGMQYGDPWDMDLKEVSVNDFQDLLGYEIEFITRDPYHKVIELFIPWHEFGGGCRILEEPIPGSKYAFSPGYNERDPNEYILGDGDKLRWLGGDPWWAEGSKTPCPMYWGDLLMGPAIDNNK